MRSTLLILPFAAKQIPGGDWGRTEVGMGVLTAGVIPTPILAFPLKGKE
jgi:hypothetical protein